MVIHSKLLKYKFHILFTVAFSLLIFSIIYLAPKFVDLVFYFWPLLLSTALFLVAVFVFERTLPLGTEAPVEKVGEGLLDYVAADHPEVEVIQHEEEEAAEEESFESEPKM